MTGFNGEAFAEQVIGAVKGFFTAEVKKLLAQIEAQAATIAEQSGRIKALEGAAAPRDALIDQDGVLVLTMTNGEAKRVGKVVGRDGADAKGIDGVDGLGFDDLTFEQTGDRSAVLRFARGEHVKEFPLSLPCFIDRGVWKDDSTYERGDGVTYGGSFWLAGADPEGRPDTGKGWRLAVKKGRDGRDGETKAAHEPKPVRTA